MHSVYCSDLKVDADSRLQAAQTPAVLSSAQVQTGLQEVYLRDRRIFLYAQVQKVLGCSVLTCRGIMGQLSEFHISSAQVFNSETHLEGTWRMPYNTSSLTCQEQLWWLFPRSYLSVLAKMVEFVQEQEQNPGKGLKQY